MVKAAKEKAAAEASLKAAQDTAVFSSIVSHKEPEKVAEVIQEKGVSFEEEIEKVTIL